MTANDARLLGQRVLVVEDDYYVAHSLAVALEAHGIEVVGPVASVKKALDLIAQAERLDGAVLDINLKGEFVYSLADALREQGVPFVFTTGYDASSVAPQVRGAVCFEKPVTTTQLIDALFG